jgi:SAM-dependent methyltransferase
MSKKGNAAHPADRFYDELGEGYERMINWKARIEREGAFFRDLFEERGTQSVLDVGCGTGHHAIEFARWGLSAAGCDISAEMLRLAERNASEAGVIVDFFEAGFADVDKKAGNQKFDAAICIGNSLPHLLSQRELDSAMRSIKRILSPGGVFVSQIRNYARILRDDLRFMPPTSAEHGGKEYVFFRMLDINGPESIDFNIIRLVRESKKWTHSVQTTRLRPILKTHMTSALERAGFKKTRHYADYSLTRFGINKTLDLITVAT